MYLWFFIVVATGQIVGPFSSHRQCEAVRTDTIEMVVAIKPDLKPPVASFCYAVNQTK